MAEATTYPVPGIALALMRRVDAEYQAQLNATADEVVTLLQIDREANEVSVNFQTGLVTVTPKADKAKV